MVEVPIKKREKFGVWIERENYLVELTSWCVDQNATLDNLKIMIN